MDSGVKTILLDEMSLPKLDLIDETGVLEKDFVADALRVLRRLHPTCHVFRFSPIVECDGIRWQPDAAVLDRELGYIFVIEFERSGKSLEKHVLPQVTGFRDGVYGDDAAASIAANAYLSLEQARSILQFVPRMVAVVVNAESPTWRSRLASENIQMLSISRYGQQAGRTAFLIEGLLESPSRFLGIGRVYSTVPGILIKKSEFWCAKQYVIRGPSGRNTWTGLEDGRSLWLLKDKGVVDIEDGVFVRFTVDADNVLTMTVI